MVEMLAGGNTSFNVLLNSLAKAFPDATTLEINMSAVLPYVFGIFVPILLGTVVGRKIGYRPVLIVSCLLYAIGAAGPAVFHSSYSMLLVFRAVFGVGIAGTSVAMALIIVFYKDLKTRSKVLGWAMFAMNGAAIVWSIASGYLAEVNVFLAFAVYLIAILPLLFSIFVLKDPFDKLDAKKEVIPEEAKAVKTKGKFRAVSWIYMICSGMMMLLQFQFQLAISSWIAKNNLGTAATAGYVISAFTVGGLIGGIFFHKVFMTTRRYSFFVLCLLFCAGMALVYFPNNIILYCIGAMLIGFSVTGSIVVIGICLGDTTDATTITMANGLNSAMGYGGMFASAFVFNLFSKIGGAVGGPILCSCVLFGIFAVLFLIVNPLPKETRERFVNEG